MAADYTPFPLAAWYERPGVAVPARAHKMMAAGPNGSGGVATEMLSVDQIFSLMSAGDIKPFADPSMKRLSKSADYTATVDDNGKIIAFTTAGRTLTLPRASFALASSEGFKLIASAQAGAVTIARSNTDTILGATSITLNQGETAVLFLDADGTGWRAAITPTYNTVARTDLANIFTQRQHWSKGTNIASAASIALPGNGNFFDVTGVAAISAISTVTQAGTRISLRATGAWTLQHNAVSMIIPRAMNLSVAVGDVLELCSLGAGNYLVTNVCKADGTPLAGSATYESPNQTYVINGPGSVAHGLAAKPNWQICKAVCIADNNGWVTGEDFDMASFGMVSSAAFGIAVSATATTINWRVASAGLPLISKANGNVITMPTASWALRFKGGL